MASLSGKQQENIEAKWRLEDARDKNLVQIADAIREMVKVRVELVRGIDALESQVPESVEVLWDRVDELHNRGRDRFGEWLEAYDLIKSVFGN